MARHPNDVRSCLKEKYAFFPAVIYGIAGKIRFAMMFVALISRRWPGKLLQRRTMVSQHRIVETWRLDVLDRLEPCPEPNHLHDYIGYDEGPEGHPRQERHYGGWRTSRKVSLSFSKPCVLSSHTWRRPDYYPSISPVPRRDARDGSTVSY